MWFVDIGSYLSCLASPRSLLPKVDCQPCQGPPEQLAHTVGWPLRDQRLCPPRCHDLERLQAKRQRLQNGVPIINGREETGASPGEEVRRPIPALEDSQLNQAQVSLLWGNHPGECDTGANLSPGGGQGKVATFWFRPLLSPAGCQHWQGAAEELSTPLQVSISTLG